MPVVPQAFQGYRLLQEYFALPQRFLFVDFAGLERAVKRCDGQELELLVLFERFDPTLESSVGSAQFVPFCTPAINLFPRRVDRIHLTDRVHEHHVIADRTRPTDFEIHSLQRVTGHGTGPDQEFLPFYAVRDPSRYGRDQAYYLVRREPRVLSSEQLKDCVYGFGDEVEGNALNVHIHHLRRKLGNSIVETVRGLGYRLGPAQAPEEAAT